MSITNPALEAALAEVTIPRSGPVPRPPGATARATGTGLVRVQVSELHPDPNNLREEITDVSELAASIEQVGLLQPIIARRAPDDDRLVVVCGHRRLAALKMLGWATVDAVVRREMPPDQVLVAMLSENGQRVQLDPIEEARAFNRLRVMYDLHHADVAARVGRTQSYVSGRLALLNLSPQEQEEVRAGQRTLGQSITQARVAAGKVRNRDKGAGWHLSYTHPLAARARARCLKLEHPKGTRLGGVACGRCWESVIRSDEKQALHDHSTRRGECALCGSPTAGIRVTPGSEHLGAGDVVTTTSET